MLVRDLEVTKITRITKRGRRTLFTLDPRAIAKELQPLMDCEVLPYDEGRFYIYGNQPANTLCMLLKAKPK